MENASILLSNLTDGDVEKIEILQRDKETWVYVAIALIGIVITVGCAGNLMVVFAIRKVKKLQTVSNIFVLNLSICDLLFVGFVLPFNIYTYMADGWFMASSLCKFVGFLGYTLTGTTIITITLIAYNRYKLVLDPGTYKELYTRRNIILMILVAWMVPIVCLIPALIGVWGRFGYVVMMVTCNLLLDHESQFFKIFLMIVRAVIPCCLIVYYYARIYHVTISSHKRLYKNNRPVSALDLHNQRKEMHMTRMMLTIFLVFVISYFPCTITGIVDWNTVLSKQFHMFCQISIYVGSAVNPLVYGLMNSQFRQAYLHMICICIDHKKTHNSSSTNIFKNSFVKGNKICRISTLRTSSKPSKKVRAVKNGRHISRNEIDHVLESISSKDSSMMKSCDPLLDVVVDKNNLSNRPMFTL